MKSEELKQLVKEKYTGIALENKNSNIDCCNGQSSCCDNTSYVIMSEDYTSLQGYNPDADLNLGCGLPTQIANIQQGNIVIDLGSGAGNDCFIAAAETGETGQIIGIDFSEAMIEKAVKNAERRNQKNVSFRLGDIEDMPVENNLADVVISNCVLNLLPEKNKIFKEILRVLKPGGHFCISDIVIYGELPKELIKDVEMYAGCVSGAIKKDEYLANIITAGFEKVEIKKEKPIILPDDLLRKYLSETEFEIFKKQSANIITSITVTGVKPMASNNELSC
jgi:SAM-dependent methyltransferase